MRLLKQDIDTFKGLGDEGFNKPENYRLHWVRLENTVNFINKYYPKYSPESFLDVAGPSILGKKLAKGYLSDYHHTSGNIDHTTWSAPVKKVHTVLMMEVLEHILNPLQFFSELKNRVEFTTMVVTWPSRPSWLWTNIHFHEMRLDRFEYLCKLAGYEILDVEKHKLPESWYNKFRGIRPFFRYWVNYHYMALIKPIK